MAKGLESYVSGKIARTAPMENTPAIRAALSGSRVVPDTWGSYATHLMDHLDIGPEEAITLLKLTPDMIADPTIQFEMNGGYGFQYTLSDYQQKMLEEFKKDAYKEFGPEIKRLLDVVEVVRKGFEVEDSAAAALQAELLQAEIEGIGKGKSINEFTPEERKASDLLVLRRDALRSGVVVQLDEFVKIMLRTNILDPDQPSKLAGLWIDAIFESIDYFWNDYRYSESNLHAGEIVAGRRLFDEMRSIITRCHKPTRDYAQAQWERIKPVFIAPFVKDLPLVAGTER